MVIFSLGLFLTVWFFVGTNWVFKEYIDCGIRSIETFCDPIYKFIFGSMIANCIFVGIVLFLLVFMLIYGIVKICKE